MYIWAYGGEEMVDRKNKHEFIYWKNAHMGICYIRVITSCIMYFVPS